MTPMNLSESEKQVLYDLYRGFEPCAIASRRGITPDGLWKKFNRTAKREGCRNTMSLLVRFIDEYLGVSDPYPAIAEPLAALAKGAAG